MKLRDIVKRMMREDRPPVVSTPFDPDGGVVHRFFEGFVGTVSGAMPDINVDLVSEKTTEVSRETREKVQTYRGEHATVTITRRRTVRGIKGA